MKYYLLVIFLVFGMFGSVNADVITLINGHKIDCQSVNLKDGRAIIQHETGKIAIPRNLIAKVESGSLAAIQSNILAKTSKHWMCGR